MNKTFGEYSTMSFYRRDSHNDIYAKSKTYYVTSENFWDNGRTYLEEPEKIGVATDTFTVSTVIDSLVFYDYREKATPDKIVSPIKATVVNFVRILFIYLLIFSIIAR